MQEAFHLVLQEGEGVVEAGETLDEEEGEALQLMEEKIREVYKTQDKDFSLNLSGGNVEVG